MTPGSRLALWLALAAPCLSCHPPGPNPDACALPSWFNCSTGSPPLFVGFPEPVGPIHCGTRLYKCPESPTQTEPVVTLANADPNAGYTVAMIVRTPTTTTPPTPPRASPAVRWPPGRRPPPGRWPPVASLPGRAPLTGGAHAGRQQQRAALAGGQRPGQGTPHRLPQREHHRRRDDSPTIPRPPPTRPRYSRPHGLRARVRPVCGARPAL